MARHVPFTRQCYVYTRSTKSPPEGMPSGLDIYLPFGKKMANEMSNKWRVTKWKEDFKKKLIKLKKII